MNSGTDQLRVIISGRVQGVGFRYALCIRARELGLCGWVRNLPDGRVEALCRGEHAAMESLLEWCGQGPRMARVDHVQTAWEVAGEVFSGFHIRG